MKPTLFFLSSALLWATASFAGDGTEANPFSVSELNAASATLTATDTVWVKADLVGMGVSGSAALNDADQRADSAAVFSDGAASVVAWSYEILGGLAVDDLTNTKGLLLRGMFRNDDASEGRHFSLYELYGALTLSFPQGYRGFHIQASYRMPQGVKGCNVRAGYSSVSGKATVSYTYYSGDSLWISGKNTALVLIGAPGDHDFVLTSQHKPYAMSAGLSAGLQEGLNTVTTGNRYLFRFIATADSVGFVRNCDAQKQVWLAAKDEVSLIVSSLTNSYWTYGHFDDGEAKRWIKWTGETPADIPSAGITETVVDASGSRQFYDLYGRRLQQAPHRGIYIVNGKKIVLPVCSDVR